MGLKLNIYNRWVTNKIIDGKQFTIAWYVDYNKISHMNPKVVTSILEAVKGKFWRACD